MSCRDHIEISRLAYAIWECEGRPHGHDVRHWHMAWKLAEAAAMAPDRASAAPLHERMPHRLQLQPDWLNSLLKLSI